MSDIEKIIESFKKEMTSDIPEMFKVSEKRKKIAATCAISSFLHFFINSTQPKVLYYSDFIKYVRFAHPEGGSKVEEKIQNVAETIYSMKYHLFQDYPLYKFITMSLLNKYNDNSDTKRKSIVYKGHSPFLLCYVLKYWYNLPSLGKHFQWECISEGLVPLYEDLNEYYSKATPINMMITHQLCEDMLGMDYLAFLLKNAENIEDICNHCNQPVMTIICLLRFLPDVKLSKDFFYHLTQKLEEEVIIENIGVKLKEFLTQTLLFMTNYELVFPTYISHAITCDTEPNIPKGESKIKEATIGITDSSLHNICRYFIEKESLTSLKQNYNEACSILKKKSEEHSDFEFQLVCTYYGLRSPYVSVMHCCQQFNCTIESACTRIADNILKNFNS